MTLLFMESFKHHVTADLSKKWTAVTTNAAISAGLGRRGGACYTNSSNQAGLAKTVPQGASFVMGMAFYLSALPTIAARSIFALLDGGTFQCDLRVNLDGTLSVTRFGTVLTDGTSVGALSLAAWNYIEWKVTIADSISAGSCVVKVNGATVITVATGQDTKNTANAFANQVGIGHYNGASSGGGSVRIEDFYICDQSGSVNNDFLGDCRVDMVLPTGDGTYQDFTKSAGSTHYELVDEAAPNTTDYVYSTTVGHRDSFTNPALPTLTDQSIFGVQVNAAVSKDDAGARSAGVMIRSGTTDSDGAGVALSTSQVYLSQIYETNPDGAVPWTESAVNAAEIGVKVTA